MKIIISHEEILEIIKDRVCEKLGISSLRVKSVIPVKPNPIVQVMYVQGDFHTSLGGGQGGSSSDNIHRFDIEVKLDD